MPRQKLADFDFSTAQTEGARALLLARPLAREEPALKPDGRWLVSDGVRVEDHGDGVWRFEVAHFPKEPLRPAMAELPLPEGFGFKAGSMLMFQHRMIPSAKSPEVPSGDSRFSTRTGNWGASVDVFFRTANGNLYKGTPQLAPTETWKTYAQSAQNFTLWFYGRGALPWRFSENRPVSLVFFLKPKQLPFTLEVKQAEIVKFAKP